MIVTLLFVLQLSAGLAPLLAGSRDPAPAEVARQVAEGVGEFVRESGPVTGVRVYVIEENHASLRGQVQIATMLTRLFKREGMRTVGLEGAMQADQPLPAKTFIPGDNQPARGDALRQLLGEGEISGAEYVGAAFPEVQIWGLEKKEQYQVKPPEGLSPSFMAVLLIATKLVPEEKLLEFERLSSEGKAAAALDVLKSGNPWVRQQLDAMVKEDFSLTSLRERAQAILSKAEELRVELPAQVRTGMRQTERFYEVAQLREKTMADAMVALAKKRPSEPSAMIIGAAHTERVLQMLSEAGTHALLLRPKNLKPVQGDPGLKIFENKAAGRWGNDAEGSFGFFLNRAARAGSPAARERKPEPIVGDPSRQSLASMQYATSVIAHAARSGRRIPDELDKELMNLPGGVSIDPKSFSQEGYDVIFCLVLDQPGKPQQRFWVRSGTVLPEEKRAPTAPVIIPDSKEGDLMQLAAAGNEPPRKPPGEDKPAASGEEPPDGRRRGDGKGEPPNVEGSARPALAADPQTRFKVFESQAEAQTCPMLSSQ